ncbi:rapid alkalinization factor 23-like [Bidens hawaiensis]|uniref:rapid alkalinization factor 23-like n=1 Tax=Bidens hawaiensis TaxID=980011 RepID=UPI00404B8A2D
MSKPVNLLVIYALILITHVNTVSIPTVDAAADHHIGWIPTTDLDLEIDEMELMDSETNRRILATNRRYISYGALSKNNVPCSRRGASYYNCRSGGQANPYTRGCSAITRCRR